MEKNLNISKLLEQLEKMLTKKEYKEMKKNVKELVEEDMKNKEFDNDLDWKVLSKKKKEYYNERHTFWLKYMLDTAKSQNSSFTELNKNIDKLNKYFEGFFELIESIKEKFASNKK